MGLTKVYIIWMAVLWKLDKVDSMQEIFDCQRHFLTWKELVTCENKIWMNKLKIKYE